jgi:hypothetical protein
LNAVPNLETGAGCEWSRSKATTPTPGWTAEWAPLRNSGKPEKDVPSWHVTDCPQYVQDSPRRLAVVVLDKEKYKGRYPMIYTAVDKATGEILARGLSGDVAASLGYTTSRPVREAVRRGNSKYIITAREMTETEKRTYRRKRT